MNTPNQEPDEHAAVTQDISDADAPMSMMGTNSQTSTFGRNSQDFEEASLPVPKTLGRYEVSDRIGRGAFGEVYLGWDPRLLREVAIKVPRIRGKQTGEQVEDLLQEAQRAVQLEQHRGIVPVYDVGRDGDVAYIVSKYVRGGTLAELMQRELSLVQKLNMMADLADAIHFAHCHGWVHRDIKPSNVLVNDQLDVFVTDFGLTIRAVELDAENMAQGTPNYMPPELVALASRGKAEAKAEAAAAPAMDHRGDIFSLGVVLFELLTGERPFQGQTLAELFAAITTAEVPFATELCPEIPAQLDRVCRRALAKDPDDRFQSAEDLRDQLRAISDACRQTEFDAEHARQVQGSSRGIWIAGGILLAIGLGIAAFLITRNLLSPSNSIAPQGNTSSDVQVAAVSPGTDDEKEERSSTSDKADTSDGPLPRVSPRTNVAGTQPARPPRGNSSTVPNMTKRFSHPMAGAVQADAEKRPLDLRGWLDRGQVQLSQRQIAAAELSYTEAWNIAKDRDDVQLTTLVVNELEKACESTRQLDQEGGSQLQRKLLTGWLHELLKNRQLESAQNVAVRLEQLDVPPSPSTVELLKQLRSLDAKP